MSTQQMCGTATDADSSSTPASAAASPPPLPAAAPAPAPSAGHRASPPGAAAAPAPAARRRASHACAPKPCGDADRPDQPSKQSSESPDRSAAASSCAE